MINGLGVVGWGVGGIEAEAVHARPAALTCSSRRSSASSCTASCREGATATDLVLTVTQMLRKQGVVGKFVEFFGPGLASLSLPDRATIANMAPEYGATDGLLPGRRRDAALPALHRPAAPSRSTWSSATPRSRASSAPTTAPDPEFTDTLELDLGDRRAQPGRAQAPAGPRAAARRRRRPSARPAAARRSPAKGEAPSCRDAAQRDADAGVRRVTRARARPRRRGHRRHHSCTNTSNPSVHDRPRACWRRRPSSAA